IGWIFALGWFITSTVSMLILVHHPPAGPDLLIPSVDYQKEFTGRNSLSSPSIGLTPPDLILFCFPFFILKHLTLRTEQKLGLVGVFSLGAITMSVSLARFIISNAADYQLDYPSGKIDYAIENTYKHHKPRIQLEAVKPKSLFQHDRIQVEDCIAGLCGMGCHGR
uniref:Rhodopsin domain-containing protein n=1 Tax=Fusarium oxysporum (strain Fo5176) TaxID=660025 RepID=A0A0D2XNR3_FUSOF